MAALTSAGLADLVEAAARPEARPSAAQLLPVTAAAEGVSRRGRLAVGAARRGPRELAPAAEALVRSGGKRVRPLLTVLSGRAAAPGRRSRGRAALAVVAELVHSATLLHDDVIDDGLTRRGMPAPRVAYGNGVSVLAGDWLLAASLDLALRSRAPGAVEALVRTLRILVEGEARQLALRGSTGVTQEDALTIAAEKTGSLLAWCGEAGELQHARVRAFAVKLNRTGALGAARRIAERERDAALEALGPVPQSPTRDLLAQVAQVLLSRSR